MKSLKIARIAAVALVAAASAAAFAADSQNLAVSATVSGTCKLTAYPAMSFTLDPSVGGAASATSAVQYKCTKGLSAGSFTVGGQSNGTTGAGGTLTNASTDTIAYTINWTTPGAFTGTGFGAGSTANTVTLNGAIAAAAYQNVSAGTYNGTIAVTIAP
jgi:spore coat protein U-like protein